MAASAAAVAGGGYATVERAVPHGGANKPAKVSQQPARDASVAARPAVTPPAAVRKASKQQVPRRAVNEFAGAGSTTRAASPEFEPAAGARDAVHARGGGSRARARPASTPRTAASAPEFGGAQPAPEFGG